jgi:hypothetical protein
MEQEFEKSKAYKDKLGEIAMETNLNRKAEVSCKYAIKLSSISLSVCRFPPSID